LWQTARVLRQRLALFFALGTLALAADASAAGPLGPQGSRIGTSQYNVDLYQGPVLATTRIIGMGGAFTAVAEDTDAIPFNPAAASVRAPWSHAKTDYDITGGLTLPGSLPGAVNKTDFDNNGTVGFSYKNFFWLSGGGILQFGHLGMGFLAQFQNYNLGVPGAQRPLLPGSNEVVASVSIRTLKVDPVVSYGFLNDQIHIGGGLRVAGFFGVGQSGPPGQEASNERLLLQSFALGVQTGALWQPPDLPLRIGLALRSPAWAVKNDSDSGRVQKDANGDREIGNLFLPDELSLPWEAEVGIAVQLWKRPLNIPWMDEDQVPKPDTERWRRDQKNGVPEPEYLGARRMIKARYKAIPRQKVLLTASTVITGPTKNAVGLESMLSQVVDRSGQNTVVGVRAGVETEVIPWWLVVRAGSYVEPTRYQDGQTRIHGSAGLDVRVLRWSVFDLFDEDTLFRLSLSGDLARNYFGWGIGAGFIH
jgi:hypothetical protein